MGTKTAVRKVYMGKDLQLSFTDTHLEDTHLEDTHLEDTHLEDTCQGKKISLSKFFDFSFFMSCR